jgi:hypothetical protein
MVRAVPPLPLMPNPPLNRGTEYKRNGVRTKGKSAC